MNYNKLRIKKKINASLKHILLVNKRNIFVDLRKTNSRKH